jgi:hypothetical protein
MKRELQ